MTISVVVLGQVGLGRSCPFIELQALRDRYDDTLPNSYREVANMQVITQQLKRIYLSNGYVCEKPAGHARRDGSCVRRRLPWFGRQLLQRRGGCFGG